MPGSALTRTSDPHPAQSDTAQPAGSRLRTALLALTSIALSLAAVALLLEVGLRFLPVFEPLETQPVNSRSPYKHLRPNRDATYSEGWNFALVNEVHVNNVGFVNDQDYDATTTTPLVAVIGDSYIEALMVPYQRTLQGRMAQALGPATRVYSFGTSGSALSDYLMYAQYARDTFKPGALVVTIVGNDFDESLLEYKSEPAHHYFKTGEDGTLQLQLVPFDPPRWQRWLAASALVRYLYVNVSLPRVLSTLRGGQRGEFVGNVAAEYDEQRAHKSMQAVDRFLRLLPAHSGLSAQQVLFVIDGMRPDLYTPQGLQRAEHSYFAAMRNYFMEQAVTAGYRVVDMQPRFIARHASDGTRFEWSFDSHWNEHAHAEAAQAVLESGLLSDVTKPAAP